jgi:hypothetical protein
MNSMLFVVLGRVICEFFALKFSVVCSDLYLFVVLNYHQRQV